MERIESILAISESHPWIFWPIAIIVGICLYFWPTANVKPKHKGWMGFLNLFAGWTGIAWALLFLISLFLMESDEEKKERERQEAQDKLDEEHKKKIEEEREEFIRLANKEADDKLDQLKAGNRIIN